jgi:hypothetical protein
MLNVLQVSFFLFLSLGSCNPNFTEKEDVEDTLLAEVRQQKLFLSELQNLFHENLSPEDSIALVHAFTQRWVKDQLLLAKATENIPADMNIERLVRDYRQSLILTNYEQLLVESRLDSNIPEQELIDYYEENKEQYILEKPIARYHFLKIPLTAKNRNQALKWWSNPTPTSMKRLRHYAGQYAPVSMLEDTVWTSLDDLLLITSPSITAVEELKAGKEIRYQDKDFQYLLRILETRSIFEVAPLGYIRERASRTILHQRKIELIEKIKEGLFDMEMRNNNLKIYTN